MRKRSRRLRMEDIMFGKNENEEEALREVEKKKREEDEQKILLGYRKVNIP